MHRSRSQLDSYHPTKNIPLHKAGSIPKSCRNISPISSDRHKYELKQKIWPKQTVESWFANHSTDERRAVYSFLNTIYDDDNEENEQTTSKHVPMIRARKSPSLRLTNRTKTPAVNSTNHSLQRRVSNVARHESRASKRDLGEILESLESFRPSPTFEEKGIQTSSTLLTGPLPQVKIEKQSSSQRPVTSLDKYTEIILPQTLTNVNNQELDNTKQSRRYLSHSWRVINPRDDMEPNVRPENNSSSFFNYTKKVYPEYFFIHPDWY